MKAISLWHPWASLIKMKLKWIETRSWSTSYRGDLLICSAKKKDKVLKDYHYQHIRPILFDMSPISAVANHIDSSYRFHEYDDFSFGQALCIARLKDCVLMTPEFIEKQSKTEISFGHWEPGRYAWIFDDIIPLKFPFPVTGKQCLFDIVHENLEYIVVSWFDCDREETLFNVALFDEFLWLKSRQEVGDDVDIIFRGSYQDCEEYLDDRG